MEYVLKLVLVQRLAKFVQSVNYQLVVNVVIALVVLVKWLLLAVRGLAPITLIVRFPLV